MNYYNIYFKGKKINNRPLNDEELKNGQEQKDIYKRNNITNSLEKISTNDIYAVKTIII